MAQLDEKGKLVQDDTSTSRTMAPDVESSVEEKHGPHGAKLSLLPLIALIYFEVSGGPYGVEESVKFGGPALAIAGFLIFPLLWSVPEALITAELGTTFPENGGYVVWISAAFGPFWGFQEGWWKWLSGVIDNSLYPVLFLDYLKREMPMFGEGPVRVIALIAITAILTYLNYRGLTIVGAAAVALTVFGLMPFAFMAVIAIPRIKPSRWFVCNLRTTNWRGYLNTLFWNLNYWDSVSTLAGEVENPRQAFPRALTGAVVLVVVSYLVPLLVSTGALPADQGSWDDGYFADVATALGGRWLGWWMAMAAAVSNMGLFEAEMSSDSFQLLGMAERGMLPEVFAVRSKHGTPVLGIMASATGVVLLSWMTFDEILELLNFLYCLGMLLEFAAFVSLRIRQPELDRPYRVPLGTAGVIAMCMVPSIFLFIVMGLASWPTVALSTLVAALGFGLYPLLMLAKREGWLQFIVEDSLPDLPETAEGLNPGSSAPEFKGPLAKPAAEADNLPHQNGIELAEPQEAAHGDFSSERDSTPLLASTDRTVTSSPPVASS